MTLEIRIYVEGGGDGAQTKADLRQGMSDFLKPLSEMARQKRIRWSVIACGGRNATFDAFQTALRSHPEAFNVLLVDSEDRVAHLSRRHLQERDGWDTSNIDEESCHLMVRAMESWFLADVEALAKYYGQGFNISALPKRADVEAIDKTAVASALDAATRKTQKKTYHKTRHGPTILSRLNPQKVRGASAHCERLFQILEAQINER